MFFCIILCYRAFVQRFRDGSTAGIQDFFPENFVLCSYAAFPFVPLPSKSLNPDILIPCLLFSRYPDILVPLLRHAGWAGWFYITINQPVSCHFCKISKIRHLRHAIWVEWIATLQPFQSEGCKVAHIYKAITRNIEF